MVTLIRSMDIGGYRHNFDGFKEIFIFPMSINKERMTMVLL